jgi:hypothetical protein
VDHPPGGAGGVSASLVIGPLQMADQSSARLVTQVLGTLRVGYSAKISNGPVAAVVGVETDAIAIGILYREIMMAIKRGVCDG